MVKLLLGIFLFVSVGVCQAQTKYRYIEIGENSDVYMEQYIGRNVMFVQDTFDIKINKKGKEFHFTEPSLKMRAEFSNFQIIDGPPDEYHIKADSAVLTNIRLIKAYPQSIFFSAELKMDTAVYDVRIRRPKTESTGLLFLHEAESEKVVYDTDPNKKVKAKTDKKKKHILLGFGAGVAIIGSYLLFLFFI